MYSPTMRTMSACCLTVWEKLSDTACLAVQSLSLNEWQAICVRFGMLERDEALVVSRLTNDSHPRNFVTQAVSILSELKRRERNLPVRDRFLHESHCGCAWRKSEISG